MYSNSREQSIRMSRQIHIGTIITAHGIKGAVKVRIFSDNIANVKNYNLTNAQGKKIKLTFTKILGEDMAICAVGGVVDRNEAEKLIGSKLFVLRSELPKPEEGEFYIADLIGLNVLDQNKQTLGTVSNVYNFGAGDIIELQSSNNKKRLINFTKKDFPVVDVSKGFLTFLSEK